MAPKKMKALRRGDFGLLQGKTTDSVVSQLCDVITVVSKQFPKLIEDASALVWYGVLEIGSFTLLPVDGWDVAKWNQRPKRSFVVQIQLFIDQYDKIAQISSENEFNRRYQAYSKKVIRCLKSSAKRFPAKLKRKSVFFVDGSEIISAGNLNWIAGEKLKAPADPIKKMLLICEQNGLIPEWTFTGSEKGFKALWLYRATNSERCVNSIVDLLKEIPKAFRPKKCYVDAEARFPDSRLQQLKGFFEASGLKLVGFDDFQMHIDKAAFEYWQDLVSAK